MDPILEKVMAEKSCAGKYGRARQLGRVEEFTNLYEEKPREYFTKKMISPIDDP